MPDQHDLTPDAASLVPDEASQAPSETIEDEDGSPEAPVRPRELTPHDAAALARIREVAGEAATVALDLKGEDIRLLTMHELVTYTDFLVLCTGRSTRQTRRIAEEIGVRLKKAHGLLPHSVEGDRTGEWILMDYLDFIVHVFTPETREFYRLDNLWKTAPVEVVEDAAPTEVPE
ncbi:MAG: ribosome silencing factor [Actinobacteria bacterium]|nr:ribosome silencing factor [Actinomycetota bacterium]